MRHRVYLRLYGVEIILGGLLFLTWGYIDRPHIISASLNVTVRVLSFVVPALFLVGLLGLSLLCVRRTGLLIWVGLVLAFCGSVWGMAESVTNVDSLYVFFADLRLPPYLVGWLFPMVSGMTLVGSATVGAKDLRYIGSSVLAIGAFGWLYYLTDSGAILEARLVHVGFGLLFGLGWVALGCAFWARGAYRTNESNIES
jgi:hypothetical protein